MEVLKLAATVFTSLYFWTLWPNGHVIFSAISRNLGFVDSRSFLGAGNLDLTGAKNVFKADRNPWVHPIQEQFLLGITHVFDYIRSDTYK